MENTDKRAFVNMLIDKGKAEGRLTAQEIDSAIVEMDFDIDELDKLYETIEQNNIEIIDDMSDAAHDPLLLIRKQPRTLM